MKYVYWWLKSSCFEFFGGEKFLSLSQKVDGNMIFTDFWKVLGLIFLGMGNTAFFDPKSWWRDVIYWLLKRSCFELFGYRKYGIFLSPEVDGGMIFTD